MTETNELILKKLGDLLRSRREHLSYSQRDVASMTGLTMTTIAAMERGSGSTMHNFLLVCRALNFQPRKFFPEDMDLTPLYDISPQSKSRIDLRTKLERLVSESDFFTVPRRVSEVLEELDYDRSVSNKFSVYLSAYCREGELEYVKTGNVKRYIKAKSPTKE
ncbi:helix-turn-helix domain-containing protein [Sphingobacterium corticibacter]|uniref:helix-turn-helix domain-containing protein n=1 Tax=Sphingobacterium corticibacter TaxID=2171749 RepID=UPI0013FD18DC|nr:helix-turn-helix transcriptional regulator [Sphingobacterium corticibacter]